MIVERVDNHGFHGDNKYYLYSDFNVSSFEELLQLGHEEKQNPPNWHQLEQDLRYSPMFDKAFSISTDKVNYFGLTLINGKMGHSSENGLKFAFDSLGIEWTQNEKDALNNILQKNNFITRIL